MRRTVSPIIAVWLGLALAGLSCQGGAGDLVGGGKKDKSGGTERDGGSSGDDESAPATEPVEVSGSFLTADCDLVPADGPAPPAEGEEVIGCMVVDKDSHQRTARKAKINKLSLVASDHSKIEARFLPAPAASPWHTYGRVPAGSMADAVAIVADIEADGTSGTTVNKEPRAIATVPNYTARALPTRIEIQATSSEPYSFLMTDGKKKPAEPTSDGTMTFTLARQPINGIVVTLNPKSDVELTIRRTLGGHAVGDDCVVSTKKDVYRDVLWCEVSGEIDGIEIDYHPLGSYVGMLEMLLDRPPSE